MAFESSWGTTSSLTLQTAPRETPRNTPIGFAAWALQLSLRHLQPLFCSLFRSLAYQRKQYRLKIRRFRATRGTHDNACGSQHHDRGRNRAASQEPITTTPDTARLPAELQLKIFSLAIEPYKTAMDEYGDHEITYDEHIGDKTIVKTFRPLDRLKPIITDIIEGFDNVFSKDFLLDAYFSTAQLSAFFEEDIRFKIYRPRSAPVFKRCIPKLTGYRIVKGTFALDAEFKKQVRSLEIGVECVDRRGSFESFIIALKSIIKACPQLARLAVSVANISTKSTDWAAETKYWLAYYVDLENFGRPNQIRLQTVEEAVFSRESHHAPCQARLEEKKPMC
ncbi:hypothetical protein LTR09_012002 [Extremus antarcticus]|uniref:Uncharacterized protein n=1 Tax=Extremus antarcticus TaxID=702011 RepID=A0AAJ0G9R6_9PEZI|nr:hypothetical protein LTR09_012002 [Extremus antarcticus]